MKRTTLITVAAVAALVVALAALGVKRVPPGHQGVRIAGSGAKTFSPGIHFVPPFGGAFVVYPAGTVEMRFPREGVYDARSKNGEKAGVALELRLDIGQGKGGAIHHEFGGDLPGRLSELVGEALAIEAALWSPSESAREALAAAVVGEIEPALERAGISVAAYRIAAWEGSAAGAATAAPASRTPLRKVIFIGVDGGDWEFIKPLVADGRLPHFKRLLEEGSAGPLRSIEPLLSPLVWTSIATGRLPEDHGILNFTVVDPQTGKKVPITRMYRKTDAVWNFLGDYGRKTDIVGWLASHPAEDINGVMVTDRVGYLAYADAGGEGTLAPGSVSPLARAGEIAGFVVKSKDVAYEDFRKILDLDREEFDKNKGIPFDPKNPVNNLIMLYASVRTYDNIARHLLAEDKPDFLGVYFEWCDAVGHLFMTYSPPRLDWVDERDYEKYKNVMIETYMLQDRIIGDYMAMCGDETVIVIASDHGFKSGAGRPRLSGEIAGGHAAFWHQPLGILALWGNGIRRGYSVEGASVLDVAPTLLALQGLPQASDMPGKVVLDAFEDSLAARVDKTVLATLGRARGGSSTPEGAGAADEEALKKLEALGYITPENPDAYNNLGQRYQEQGEYEKAIEQFTKALAINPNFPSALNNIGVCYGRVKRYDLAEASFRKALSLKKNDVYAMNNLAILFLETGKLEDAARFGEMAVQTEPNYANGHLTLGSVYATAGNLDRAEREFMKVLELDPASGPAKGNLERVRAEKSRR
ncbi:MAG: Type phosphodiesterase / nucleotide pyrophosphatase [Candidatus Krumholzibacteriota bacterium]|nr:Type phosphodiesterase / nucleotide pyrophosphatase [Candidatus Krumholzibacteriota bacterium]